MKFTGNKLGEHNVLFAFFLSFLCRCIPEINKFTKYFMNDETKEAYIPAILCLVFGHVGLYAWWIQTALLILRIICVVDFDIVVHRISSAPQAPDTTGLNVVEEAEV